MLTQELINTAAQLTVAIVIALIVWALAGKARGGFFRFVGLVSPGAGGWAAGLIGAALFVPATLALFYLTDLKDLAAGANTVAGALRASGFSGEIVGVIIVVALVKTALAEEIVFRGILAKTLIRWFGFWTGAIAHALIFGAVHALIFVAPGAPAISLAGVAAITGLPALGALAKAYINEKRANGSIWPGWLMHAFANVLAYPLLAFG